MKKYLFFINFCVLLIFDLSAGNKSIKNIRASSTLKESGFPSDFYKVENLIDNSWKSWVEGKKGDGIGEYVEIEFSENTNGNFVIKNGYGDLLHYFENNRVKDIEVQFNDEFTLIKTLEDTYDFQYVYFNLPQRYVGKIYKIRITIQSVYHGTKYDDTCVSELSFDINNISLIKDPSSALLLKQYFLEVEKCKAAKITDKLDVTYTCKNDLYDPDNPELFEYCSYTTSFQQQKNIFITSNASVFALVQNNWLSKHDHFESWNIDIYSYKNKHWVIDNDNPVFKDIRKIIEDGKKMKSCFIYTNSDTFVNISYCSGSKGGCFVTVPEFKLVELY